MPSIISVTLNNVARNLASLLVTKTRNGQDIDHQYVKVKANTLHAQ
jgi:hypothetical protein